MNLDTDFTLSAKINWKLTLDLNVKLKTVKLEDNTVEIWKTLGLVVTF